MGAMVGVDDGSFWIIAHATGTEQMHGELLLLDGIGPLLLCTGSVEDLQTMFIEPFGELDVVRMILVGQAKRGESPSVFDICVNGKAVVFFGQRSAMRKNFDCSCEIVRECVFELLAPARSVGRKAAASSEINWRHV